MGQSMDKHESSLEDENGKSSTQKPQLEPVYPWKKAWQTAKAIWPQLVYISLLCMSIPQYLLFIISTQKAFEYGQAFELKNQISLENSLEVLRGFAGSVISVGWIVAVLFLVGAFTVIALVGQVSRSEVVSTKDALGVALRSLFPRGIVFMLFLFLGSLLMVNILVQLLPVQLLKFLALFVSVLLTALPALMVVGRQRPLEAFRQSLRMSYADGTGISKWSVFFLLLTFQLLAVNFVALVEWLGISLSQLDLPMAVSREVFFQTSESSPFGKMIYVSEALFSIGIPIVITAFLVLNASFVAEIHRRHSLGRTVNLSV